MTSGMKPIKVFFSYSHKDNRLRKALEIHLSPLRRQGLIQEWHDGCITPGREWEEEIKQNLESAELVLLLISPDFIHSDYCYGVEMKRALQRHDAGQARVVPIILRSAQWQTSPFSRLQCLPTDGKPVTKWPDRDDAFLDIANGIRRAIEELCSVLTHSDRADEQLPQVVAPVDEKALRDAYLHRIMKVCDYLSLAGIDPAAASQRETDAQLSLNAVYTALLTRSSISALEQLDQNPRLVLQGDPGSGKSTFVNFVALCLAGEALGDGQVNLQRLTAPLPDEDGGDSEKPQPWSHGALLPVLVTLRDFAATGLPAHGEKATAQHFWEFIIGQLREAGIEDYAPYLRKTLLERGGLLLFDGLDEVPEAEQRREQVKQAVEDFVLTFKNCRVLVTSRIYAYQNQGWRLQISVEVMIDNKPQRRLQDFTEATLAPFSKGQIRRFVSRWYAHTASLERLSNQDAAGRAELLKQAIFNRPTLYELAQRPLLLTLMASLHAWRGGDLPEKREQLYADAVNLLLNFWEQRRIRLDIGGQPVLLQPSLAEYLKADKSKVRRVLEALAFAAHGAQPELASTADLSEDVLVGQLMRLSGNPDARPARLVEYLRDRAGLLYPRGVGVYTFPHRSFQEYLAACQLTDDGYPDKVAELARTDPDRWREVTLLAGAKAARGTAVSLWLMIDALCFREPDDPTFSSDDAWGAQIAAQVLIEVADLSQILSVANQKKLTRVRNWLTRLMCDEQLSTRQRVLAGNNLAKLGDSRPGVGLRPDGLPDLLWVRIPGTAAVRASSRFSNFTALRLGKGAGLESGARDDEAWPAGAAPVEIADFELAVYPLTVAQFRPFVVQGGYQQNCYWSDDGRWWRDREEWRTPAFWEHPDWALDNQPVRGVSWYEAEAYCNWLNEHLSSSQAIRLPTEAEWEWVARGPERRRYHWGNKWPAGRCNFSESGINRASVVGIFPRGAGDWWRAIQPDSAVIQDLVGNVWEWAASEYSRDYASAHQSASNSSVGSPRVLRGGAWSSGPLWLRGAARGRLTPHSRTSDVGFRLARTVTL